MYHRCNLYHLAPHFYIVKLWFTGIYIFLIFAQNIPCGYTLEPPHCRLIEAVLTCIHIIYVLSKNKKKYHNFSSEEHHFYRSEKSQYIAWACYRNAVYYRMSLVLRKPAFCICENKDADQLHGNREADQRLCFRYTDSTIPLLPESEMSSL